MATLPDLLQLKGKLEIMTKQINAKAQEVATGAPEEESSVAKFGEFVKPFNWVYQGNWSLFIVTDRLHLV